MSQKVWYLVVQQKGKKGMRIRRVTKSRIKAMERAKSRFEKTGKATLVARATIVKRFRKGKK